MRPLRFPYPARALGATVALAALAALAAPLGAQAPTPTASPERATGGGIWKTTDAGLTWRNVSDDQLRVGSIGSLA
ncbi:MAG: hypothetical protein KGN74_03575, partial [Gemmatimonadota bacterium]|nr:hypothetical protein [Gemmatimonadota bacterium]